MELKKCFLKSKDHVIFICALLASFSFAQHTFEKMEGHASDLITLANRMKYASYHDTAPFNDQVWEDIDTIGALIEDMKAMLPNEET